MEILDNDYESENYEKPMVNYFNKPTLIVRIKSIMIDSVVIIGLMYLFSLILDGLNIESENTRALCLILIVLYEPILITLDRTIGQRVMGLRVRNFKKFTENNEKSNINIFYSLLRYASKLMIGWISLLTIHSNNYGQAIHDKLGNSIMTLE